MPESPALDPDVLAYYERGREHERLPRYDLLEFHRTQELLRRFLPPPPAIVLDVGGAAGVHALPLQADGYDVRLIDPVALHVEQARDAGVRSVELGDARALPHLSGSADAAMLLGPLYHLVDRRDRLAALAEARRVVKPDGVVCAAVISRFASTIDGITRSHVDDPRFEAILEGVLATGVHRNPTREVGWFTTAYFHHPDEIAVEFGDAGLEEVVVLAIEGPASPPDLETRLADPERRAALLRAIARVEAEPSLLGASLHLFVRALRPA